MEIKKYLTNRLRNIGLYKLTKDEKKFIKDKGIEEYIYLKLSSKKFRKWKIQPSCIQRVKKAIHLAVSKNEPVKIVFPMGGYKLWRLPSTPETDWAEFFNIVYLLNYLAPVAAGYKPGVNLIYYIHTLLMELHDNLATEEIKAYVDSFKALTTKFNQYSPKNLQISIIRDADIYTRREYFKQLELGRIEAKKEFDTLPQEKKDKFKAMSLLNIKWNGKEDWTKLSKIDKEEKILKAAYYEMAAGSKLPKVFNTIKNEDKILVFCNATPDFIGVGSTKTSMTKYWTGFGVLEKDNSGNFYERVLSPTQLEKVKKIPHDIINVNFLPFKNFSKIWIFPKRLNFSKN
jgi:hypothetical protein